jgi:hypothetical protein
VGGHHLNDDQQNHLETSSPSPSPSLDHERATGDTIAFYFVDDRVDLLTGIYEAVQRGNCSRAVSSARQGGGGSKTGGGGGGSSSSSSSSSDSSSSDSSASDSNPAVKSAAADATDATAPPSRPRGELELR